MDFRIVTEPQQGATYGAQLRLAQAAENLGYSAFFRSDHYLYDDDLKTGASDGPGPSDAWITLGGLAVQTTRIRLGTLMTAATFRLPGVLATQVAQVDQMSGGRVELGLGAGWHEREHAAYGIPYPDPAQIRFDRLEEQLEIVTGLWRTSPGSAYSFQGEHYTLREAPGPAVSPQRKIPVLVGGTGRHRTPALAARFADEFNMPYASLEATSRQFSRVRDAVASVGRDAKSITYSVALMTCVGRNPAEFSTRAEAIGWTAESLCGRELCGSPDEIVDVLGRYAEVGTSRVYLQLLDVSDLDHLELIASQVCTQFR
jgi:F420-dependent oxidoreductase-like protein